MKRNSLFFIVILVTAFTTVKAQNPGETPASRAIVVDERLSILLTRPSLYAEPISRIRNGREVFIIKAVEGDGVTFYQVKTSENGDGGGFIQSDAVVGNFRRNDDQHLAALIYSSEGFEKIERTTYFLNLFEKSALRPSMLLLLGDLIEEQTARLSRDAAQKLDRLEMAASGAPLHSFYLSYAGLDRYRKLGIRFLFNIETLSFHYDGEAWLELEKKFPKTQEGAEAKKRIVQLREKMAQTRAPSQ